MSGAPATSPVLRSYLRLAGRAAVGAVAGAVTYRLAAAAGLAAPWRAALTSTVAATTVLIWWMSDLQRRLRAPTVLPVGRTAGPTGRDAEVPDTAAERDTDAPAVAGAGDAPH